MSALILGHKNPDTDSIVSAIVCADLYKKRGLDVVPAAQGKPAPETQFVLERFGFEAPEVVTSVAGRDVYLVDFSDRAQAPADIDEANLKGIVDHHKLGDVTSSSPLECIIWTAGCTNTILKAMYDYCGIEIPKNIAGIMLCAILSDTVIFKSPTTTDMDRKAAKELAEIAGVADLEALGMELFTAKSAVAGCSPRDLMMPAIEEELGRIRAEGRHSALFLLTDIMKEGSRLVLASEDPARVAGAFGVEVSDFMWLPGVMSRKKQVVPALEKAFRC